MTRTLRIGTRGSALALVQARWVAGRLAEHGVPTEIVVVRTDGDDRPVDTAWGEGAFVGRIVAGLLDGSVDLAVHSAKDVPTDEDPRLLIAAYPAREDPRDALVFRVRGTTLATLPKGARVGTDSPRRTAFLRAIRPDLVLHPLHGNVDTRLAKLDRGDSDVLVLAVAGLERLGHAGRIDEILASDLVPPAPGQGSLAVQVRADDREAAEAVSLLDDEASRAEVEAERAVLNGTGGGCRSPIGAIGRVHDGRLRLLAGAERSWTPAPGAPIRIHPVAWVRGEVDLADEPARRELATRLAARIVDLRLRPRVLVGRPAGRAGAVLDALHSSGVSAVHVPAIEIVPAAPGSTLDEAFGAAQPGDWVAVTSAAAAEACATAVARTGIDGTGLRWAAVGEGTARALAEAGVRVAFLPSEPNGAALARELPVGAGARVLLPRSDIADPALPATLRERGAAVTEVAAYETREAPAASRDLLARALDDGPLDALVVSSGSIARGLLALAPDDWSREQLLHTPVIAAGEPSATAARSAGFPTVLVAPSPGAADLAQFVATSLGVTPGPTRAHMTPAAQGDQP